MKRPEFETTRAISRRTRRAGSAKERPYLIGIAGEHAGRFFPLAGLRECQVGRTEDCEVFLAFDDRISRRHARFVAMDDGRWQIHDLESLNGTIVNGREVKVADLRRGDRIFLGHASIYKFDYLTDEERSQWESASVDGLTECFNRQFFEARLEQLFDLSVTSGLALSLILIDIDHFKSVNDTRGHPAGDFALHALASLIDSRLTSSHLDAITCRYGGEEFAVLLPRCDAATCAEIAESLRDAVSGAEFEFERARFTLTISIGTATLLGGSHATPAALVKVADDNLYRAKAEGRNRVVT